MYKYNLKEIFVFIALGAIFSLMTNVFFFPKPSLERLINCVANSTNPITFLEIRNIVGFYIIRVCALPVFWILPIMFLSLSALKAQKINFSMIKEVISSHCKDVIAIYALQEILGIVVSIIWYAIDTIVKCGNSIGSGGLVMIGMALYAIVVIIIIWLTPLYYIVIYYAPIIAINENLTLTSAVHKSIDLLKKSGLRIIFRSIWITFSLLVPVFILLSPLNFISTYVFATSLGVALCFVFPIETAVYFQIHEEFKYQKYYQLTSSYSKFIYKIFKV